jgi:hypothetical protein
MEVPMARSPRPRAAAVPPAPRLLSKLRQLYALPLWALFPEVRSTIGVDIEGLRTADAVALRTAGTSERWEVHGFELKVSRSDWRRELRSPHKAARVGRFCTAWWLVVPAPWKAIVLATSELPEGWGLIEVDKGGPRVVVEAPALEDAGPEDRARYHRILDPRGPSLARVLPAPAETSLAAAGGGR